jgi:hypothetical protein
MSATYARRGVEHTTFGGVIVVSISILAFVLVTAGLYYAAGTGERHKVALAAAGCEPNLSPDPASVPCTTVWDLERQYTKMTTAAVQQLNADAAAYATKEWHSLAAAEAALTAEVTSAKAFDISLARFPFPPAVAPASNALIQAIDARVKLTSEQIRSSSLTQLRSFNERVKASGAAIEADMKLVRKALFTRPTVDQEP